MANLRVRRELDKMAGVWNFFSFVTLGWESRHWYFVEGTGSKELYLLYKRPQGHRI